MIDTAGTCRQGFANAGSVVLSLCQPDLRMRPVLRFVNFLALTTWWGGLTFYAAIVVPVGTDIFGSTEQGFVTQSVTNWLNALLALTLALSLRSVIHERRPVQLATWIVLLITLVAHIGIHWQLDKLLDASTLSVNEPSTFYSLHRVYLWVTIAQWLAGIVCLWNALDRAESNSVNGPEKSRTV